ncbi:MAG: helix-turn-helix domain-containing protein [Bacteroidales bacterium]|jgi:AraC-like DNA-binding protein|nr:helix-turn-helix domain-containing protein [Bacteroidales bacterium]
MIQQIYTLNLLILAVTMVALGLMYLFLNVSDSPKLGAYRNAAKAMAFTYIFFGLANGFEYMAELSDVQDVDHSLLLRLITLIIASVQAFLFTFAIVSLINTTYMTRKRVVREIVLISLLIVLGLFFYFTGEVAIYYFVGFYTAFYLFQLVRYTFLFVNLYGNCLCELNNYFSDREAERIRWVKFSFASAFVIGLMALILSIFPSLWFGLVASLACLAFYVHFAIRFVNYAFIFNKIEEALREEPEDESADESLPEYSLSESVSALEGRIRQWVAHRQYIKQGITIKDMAVQIGTNRSYLSAYINQYEQKTFREWINGLRIEEAKRLLLENPNMERWQLAEQVGYKNCDDFSIQFKKVTGQTLTAYRQ